MKPLVHTIVWLLEVAVALLFFILVIAALIPWFLSFDGTRAILLGAIGRASHRQICIEEASFTWFGEQYVKGLSIEDGVRRATFRCEEIATEASLWQILFGSHDIGNLRVSSPYLGLQTEESLPEAVSAISKPPVLHAGPSSPSSLSLGADFCSLNANIAGLFSGNINIVGGTLEVSGPHIDTIFLSSISAEATLKKPQTGELLSFSFQGETSQKSGTGETKGNFRFNGKISPCEIQNGAKSASLALQGEVTRFPVLGLDQMLSLGRPQMRGMLVTLLGSTMDLTTTVLLRGDKGEFDLNLSSPQAKATFNAASENGQIVLRSPSRCFLALTPFLTASLFSNTFLSDLRISSSPQMLLTIDTLAIPLQETIIDWPQLKMKAHLQITNAIASSPTLPKTFKLAELQATVTTENLTEEMLIDATASLQYAEDSSALASVMQISSPLDSPAFQSGTLSAEHFPTVFIDHLLLKDGDFADLLGPAIDLRIGLEQTDNLPVATIYLFSPRIAVEEAVVAFKPQIQLQKPFKILFTPDASWLEGLLPGTTTRPVLITVNDFSMGDSLSTMALHLESGAEVLSINGYTVLHPTVLLDIMGLDKIAIDLQAEGISGTMHLSYDDQKHILSSKENSAFRVRMEPSSWEAFSSYLGKPTALISPASLSLEIQPFAVSTKTNIVDRLALAGTLQITDFALTGLNKPDSRFALQDVSFKWRLNKDKGEIAAHGGGKITGTTDVWSSFQIETLIQKLSSGAGPMTPDIVCKFAADALDTTALDPWVDTAHSLAPLLGFPLSLKVDVTQKAGSSAMSVQAKSDRLQLECGVARERDRLVLRSSKKPAYCNWTVFPEGFAVGADLWQKIYNEKMQKMPLALSKPCPITLRIDTLDLPLVANSFRFAPDALSQALFSGSLSIERLPFVETDTQNQLVLQHVECQVERRNLKSPLQFHLRSAVEAAKPGLADLKGFIRYPNSDNDNQHHVKVDANFQNIPASLPDLAAVLAGLNPHTFETIFGPALTGSMQADIEAKSGPLLVNVNTPSTRLAFNGYFNKGVLTLQEPLVAQVTMTKDFSRTLLEQANPLSLDVVTSEGPMTLTVDKEGFSFPLFPYNLSAAVIPHARIDLGKITCHNKGNLNDLLGLLKLAQFSRDKDLKLWFAPMDISLKDGVIDCQRTEILLADKFDIATWGKIDLNQDRVKAVLGLTAQALKEAFGIANLPSDYVLQLPMKGRIGHVKIDSKKATAKIALLLGVQKGAGLIGGSKGAIVGGLLGGGLAKLPDAGKPVPPAKHPFPWEQGGQGSSGQKPALSKKKRKAAIKPGKDKPLKQLLKLMR